MGNSKEGAPLTLDDLRGSSYFKSMDVWQVLLVMERLNQVQASAEDLALALEDDPKGGLEHLLQSPSSSS